MTLSDTIKKSKQEIGETLKKINNKFSSLDLDTAPLLFTKNKYSLITQEALSKSYEEIVKDKKIPPFNPSKVFDQKRLGLVDISLLGDIFLPSPPNLNNLKEVQNLYSGLGSNIERVEKSLLDNPPVDETSSKFLVTSSRFVISIVAASKANGSPKTKEDIGNELGLSFFEVFTIPEEPQNIFVVYEEFLGEDTPLSAISRKYKIPKDSIVNKVFWFGAINANSKNLFKMRSFIGLPASQIRSATFGDDIGVTNSQFFREKIDEMVRSLNSINNEKLPAISTVLNVLNAVQKEALTFLAEFNFNTSLVQDSFFLDKTRESGISDNELEFSFINRDDVSFKGADLEANSLLSTVWPVANNSKNINLLSTALQQDPDTVRFTNKELNTEPNLRKEVSFEAKELFVRTYVSSLRLSDSVPSETFIKNILLSTALAVSRLNTAYSAFLSPDPPSSRISGTRTLESTNLILLRAADIVKSLRIKDQIQQFPRDFDNEIKPELSQILDFLEFLTDAVDNYLAIYKRADIRKFLADSVSVASFNILLFSDGDPINSTFSKDFPGAVQSLALGVESNILSEESVFPETYQSIASTLDSLTNTIRGEINEDLISSLLETPLVFINSIFFVEPILVPLEGDQRPAMEQINSSFMALRRTTPAILRDLGELSSNFRCAFTEAGLFVSRTPSSSLGNLIGTLR